MQWLLDRKDTGSISIKNDGPNYLLRHFKYLIKILIIN